ncbi:MAG: TlpA family protein disulfide reductase [Bacteroidales bacterium]|jgi:peroxiredoxin|nr:TlpA family protein disulfide reductase [Bacteroidales bacterium]
MKRISLLLTGILIALNVSAQDAKLPAVSVKTLTGKSISAADFSNDGKPFVICFWATWCKPCLTELNTMAEYYEEWQNETGVKIYAVSIDDIRTSKKVLPLVKSSEWDYEVILDENSELKRAMGVNNPPHTFLCNGKGEIVWQHASYALGDEQNLINVIRKLIAEGDLQNKATATPK